MNRGSNANAPQFNIEFVFRPRPAASTHHGRDDMDLPVSDDVDDSDDDFDEDEFDNDDDDCEEFREDPEFPWLEHLDVRATSMARILDSGKPESIAYCKASMFKRSQICHDFYQEIEGPSQDSSALGFTLFDRYGRLRPEWKIHPIKNGTAVWNEGLDYQDMLLIEEIVVDEEFRRKGVGRQMIQFLLEETQKRPRPFVVFTWPGVLQRLSEISNKLDSLPTDAARVEYRGQLVDHAVSFWRSLGFRRVGSSVWFAYTPDLNHPSRRLAAADDFDPTESPFDSKLAPPLSVFQPEKESIIHVGFGRTIMPTAPQTANFLKALHDCMLEKGSADKCWTNKGRRGNTVLHSAAALFEVACVKWMMVQDFGPTLLAIRNDDGETPLELLERKLEKRRTQRTHGFMTICISDQFEGHPTNALECLSLLKGLGPTNSVNPHTMQRLRNGCICGQCLNGVLSPRMRFALLVQAEVGYDMYADGLNNLSGPEWVEDSHFLGGQLVFVPAGVRNNMKTNKSMRQGFVNLWSHIATCLNHKQMPNAENVLKALHMSSEWPPVTRNYLQRGGTVESAFLAICQGAMDQDECIGDGYHQDVFQKEIAKLPECRNDLEFGFMSGSCGYRRITPTGLI